MQCLKNIALFQVLQTITSHARLQSSLALSFLFFASLLQGMVDKVRFPNLLQLLSPGAPRMKKGQIRRSWSWSTPNSTSIFFCPLDGKTLWDTVGKKTWNTGHGNPHPSLPFKVSKWPFRPWRIWGSQENPTVTWYLAIGQKTDAGVPLKLRGGRNLAISIRISQKNLVTRNDQNWPYAHFLGQSHTVWYESRI